MTYSKTGILGVNFDALYLVPRVYILPFFPQISRPKIPKFTIFGQISRENHEN